MHGAMGELVTASLAHCVKASVFFDYSHEDRPPGRLCAFENHRPRVSTADPDASKRPTEQRLRSVTAPRDGAGTSP